MSKVMLQKLKEERDSKDTFIDGLCDTAASENRDLSTNELELITRSKDRIKSIDEQMTVLLRESTLDDAAQNRLAQLAGAAIGGTEPILYRTAGAYLHDYLQGVIGEGEKRAEAQDRMRRYERAASHITTGNFTGVFPDAIVGPLISTIDSSRPLVSSVGVNQVPSGPSFRRPRLNDPNVSTGIGSQANEKDELVSQPFTVTSDPVSLTTLGGYVNVSRQLLDWGIATLDGVVNQLAARYSIASERSAVGEMEQSTSKVTLASAATSDVVIKAIYDAAGMVYTQTGQLPTTLAAGPLGWARLGSLTSAQGVPTFPFLNPVNAQGAGSGATSFSGNPVGLNLVVSPAIADDTFWVLNALGLELYEQQVGALSVVEPSVLGVQVAFASYFGSYRPAPNGAVHCAP
jgi:HK97 family phage major capsid protein